MKEIIHGYFISVILTKNRINAKIQLPQTFSILNFGYGKVSDFFQYINPWEKDETAYTNVDGKVDPLPETRGPFGFGDAIQLNDDKVSYNLRYKLKTNYPAQCQPYVRRLPREREYRWEFLVWLQLSILYPKNTKLGKSGNFRSLKWHKFTSYPSHSAI